MHSIFDAALTLSVERCLLSFSCDTFFQWCFTCVFFPSAPTLCSPPNFHCQSPPTHNCTCLCAPQISEQFKLPLTFSLHIMEKKMMSSKRTWNSHKGLNIFENIFFCEVSSFLCIALATIRMNIGSLFACGTPKPFLPVDWFSHQKFLIMSQ